MRALDAVLSENGGGSSAGSSSSTASGSSTGLQPRPLSAQVLQLLQHWRDHSDVTAGRVPTQLAAACHQQQRLHRRVQGQGGQAGPDEVPQHR